VSRDRVGMDLVNKLLDLEKQYAHVCNYIFDLFRKYLMLLVPALGIGELSDCLERHFSRGGRLMQNKKQKIK